MQFYRGSSIPLLVEDRDRYIESLRETLAVAATCGELMRIRPEACGAAMNALEK